MQNTHQLLEILSMIFLIVAAILIIGRFIQMFFKNLRQKYFSEFARNQELDERETENFDIKIRLKKIEKKISKLK